MLPPHDVPNQKTSSYIHIMKKELKNFLRSKKIPWDYVFAQMSCILKNPKDVNRFAQNRRSIGGSLGRSDSSFIIGVLLILEILNTLWSLYYYYSFQSLVIQWLWIPFLWSITGALVATAIFTMIIISDHSEKIGKEVESNATLSPLMILGVAQLLLIPMGVMNLSSWLGCIISNMLLAASVWHYSYIINSGISLLSEVKTDVLSAFMIPPTLFALSTLFCCPFKVNMGYGFMRCLILTIGK
eukprot:GHVH01012208.1.p1 GENE.GHVH01012208.1~~GHVH01012208.1.p1  ORF type:complete len:242 (+),score=25.25 GHVH01012208.1:40-765(+)